MSMTSKVNSTLRSEIVNFLTANPNSTNSNIYFGIPSLPSQRKDSGSDPEDDDRWHARPHWQQVLRGPGHWHRVRRDCLTRWG